MSDDLLAAHQASAADAYAAITAADAALRALAGRRVAAELALRRVAARHHAVTLAVTAHARSRPGRLRRLATGFRAERDWAERLVALSRRRAEAEPPLAAAADALTRVKGEFSAQVQARAEAVTALLAATAACAAIRAEPAARAGQPLATTSQEPPPCPPVETRTRTGNSARASQSPCPPDSQPPPGARAAVQGGAPVAKRRERSERP